MTPCGTARQLRAVVAAVPVGHLPFGQGPDELREFGADLEELALVDEVFPRGQVGVDRGMRSRGRAVVDHRAREAAGS